MIYDQDTYFNKMIYLSFARFPPSVWSFPDVEKRYRVLIKFKKGNIPVWN